jgi:SAM-dependent methyltransferase
MSEKILNPHHTDHHTNHHHSDHSDHHSHHADPHNHKHTGSPETLQLSDRFFEPVDRQIVEWLKPEPGSRVLDAGCGGGGMTRLLAEAVGSTGHVIGFDANPDLLKFGQSQVANTDLNDRLKFQEGNILNLPFADGSFDLVWCSRVVHGFPDQLAGLRELCRVVRPGGRVVIREGGLAAQFIPFDLGIGKPGLNTRLQLAHQAWFAHWRASLPGWVVYPFGWMHMLTEAGLSRVAPKSFLHEFTSPLEATQIEYLVTGLNRQTEEKADKNLLSGEDVQTLKQLLDKNSPHYLFNRDDLHGIGVETLYVGYA